MNKKPELSCSAHHLKAGLGIWAGSAVNSIRALRLLDFWMGLKVLLAGVCACLAIGFLFIVFCVLMHFPGMIYLSMTDDTIRFQDMFQGILPKSVRESALVASMVIYAVLTAIYFLPRVSRRLCELGKKKVIDSEEVQS